MRAQFWPAALLLLTPVLAACGDDDGTTGADPTTEPTVAETTAPVTTPPATSQAASPTTSAAASGLPAACDIVTADDLTEAYGMPFGAPEVGGGDADDDGSAWTSDDCSFEAAGLAEVTVSLTGPQDFTQGSFGCPRPDEDEGSVEPAADIAGARNGWWKVSSPPDFEGLLRACTDKVLLDIDLDYEDGVEYEGDPLNQSVALAEKLLVAIKG